MPTDHLTLTLSAPEKLKLGLSPQEQFAIGLTQPAAGTRDYNKLTNKPTINGMPLAGNLTSADLGIISENTADGWARQPLYVPKSGEVCLYTDTGQTKIGDGTVPIADLPFFKSDDVEQVAEDLVQHVQNSERHITQSERARWDNKLNYAVSGEILILNRL